MIECTVTTSQEPTPVTHQIGAGSTTIVGLRDGVVAWHLDLDDARAAAQSLRGKPTASRGMATLPWLGCTVLVAIEASTTGLVVRRADGGPNLLAVECDGAKLAAAL